MKLTKSKIIEISNFSHSINYIRTPFAKTMVHNLQYNSSILHQNSERRVAKPEVIKPARNEHLIGEGTHVVLHCNEPNSYIVYTLDESIPCFTNGVRYDPQRAPIIVPENVLTFKIKFVACKLRMVDSEIVVRKFNVTKDVPQKQGMPTTGFNPSHAVRAAHEEPVAELNLGLETPSSSNMTPQHPSMRQSSIHNMTYIPITRVGEDDDEELSNHSDEL